MAAQREIIQLRTTFLWSAALVLATALPAAANQPACSTGEECVGSLPIDHIVVIYLENRSFDHLFGQFPGAEGPSSAGRGTAQSDQNGRIYPTLPPVGRFGVTSSRPATTLPSDLRNVPFDLAPFVPPRDLMNPSPIHRFYQEQQEINGGRMDRFAAVGGGLAMGYYDGQQLQMWRYAERYVLADHFFHAAFGGTWLNHMWLACACAPRWPDAPSTIVAQVSADGRMTKDGTVTPDGYVVNNLSAQQAQAFPLQTQRHVGDLLDAAGVSWAWFHGSWNRNRAAALQEAPFQFFASTAVGTDGGSAHLKDESEFLTSLQTGTLPQVSFVHPLPDEHPSGAGALLGGDQHAADLVQAIQASPYWESAAVIVTYDENGGFWDHLAPPAGDRWGPGSRVPAIIISPYAKKGFVDHTTYDTTSILRFIEWRWGLESLGPRDAAANNLLNAFDFPDEAAGGP